MTAVLETPFYPRSAVRISERDIPAAFVKRVALSQAEVAETLGVSLHFVRDLIADGKLRAHKVRRLRFVVAADVWALMGIAAHESNAVSDTARSLLHKVGA